MHKAHKGKEKNVLDGLLLPVEILFFPDETLPLLSAIGTEFLKLMLTFSAN